MPRTRRIPVRATGTVLASLALLASLAPMGARAGEPPACEIRNLTTPAGVLSDLATAVGAAGAGDTLQVRGTCAVPAAVLVDEPLTIVGKKTAALGAPTLTTTTTGHRILDIGLSGSSKTVTIRSLRLTGSQSPSGGAINVLSGTLVLRDVRIDDVEATGGLASGGAIYLGGGTSLVMAGTTSIRNARAAWGGGVGMAAPARLTMRDRASIAYSHATFGGGAIAVWNGAPGSIITLRDDASLHHNRTDGYGAAMNTSGTIVLRDRATIRDNDGTSATGVEDKYGSAVEIWSYGTTVTRLTLRDDAAIRGNDALAGGGGVLIWTACGDNVPTVKGARGRVTGNAPKNVVRQTSDTNC
jgi:hypothetical protein